ncbi:MAG: DUF3108 domain-containing protein [Moraxellaceae bacterium]|nr:DUF3108 domain-containing protein [Moraxellaceae bacterium]
MMPRLFSRLLTLSVFFLASPLAGAWELAPYTATYRFNLDNKLSGTATRTLEKKTGDAWRYVFNATTSMATANETSDFRFNGKTVTPLHHQQQHKVLFISKREHVNFNWQTRQAQGLRNDKKTQYVLRAGAIDPLSLEIQMRRDLIDLGKPASSYFLVDARRMNEQKFVLDGEEILDTPLGKLATVKVRRVHDDPERETVFWLARDLDYIPARVMQNDDGAMYVLDISTYSRSPAEAPGTPAKSP